MISYLRGTIISKSSNYFILDVHDIGYAIFASDNFLNEIKMGESLEVFTHHHVREEAADLYGFKNLEELELFELLLGVSGVGPKSALGVLAMASADDVKESIIRGDAELLTKVSGIGRKTAERLVLELKNKILKIAASSKLGTGMSLVSSDELDALMSLGYSLSEARAALGSVDSELKDTGERVKQALKIMKK
ncbi:MAG TPA: Holliday junction branch migration protein RuvA [Candidatus Saccharimonadales bacterium]|nr:Holliday junction branch migration protein RuvA [Candidatus Saccharimonadales bacterium]